MYVSSNQSEDGIIISPTPVLLASQEFNSGWGSSLGRHARKIHLQYVQSYHYDSVRPFDLDEVCCRSKIQFYNFIRSRVLYKMRCRDTVTCKE